MKTIHKDEYVFTVDIKKTKDYYKTHSLCECDYCRNYYTQIKGKFPKLEAFLSDFGIDISKPDHIFSVELDNSLDYISVEYTVCGKIVAIGKNEMDIYDHQLLNIKITDGFVSPNEQISNYFTISVMNINLPSVLNELN